MSLPLPPVLALGELAEVVGLSKTRIRQLIAADQLPVPIATLGVGKIWSTPDIVEWCGRTGRVAHSLKGQGASAR